MARSPAAELEDAVAAAAAATSPAEAPGTDPEAALPPEQAQHLRDQYAEIAQLAGGLAHEIRNPLSTMRLTLDLLAEDFRDPQSDRERRALQKIERVRKESHRLESLLEDFLRLVRVGGLHLAPTDLNAVVEDVRDFCEPQSLAQGVVTRFHADPDLPPIALHVDSFKQALLNLIRNAQLAMPDGGELILRTRRQPDGGARLDVIDTGSGIPPEVQPRIFDPFFSTRPRGTGLGLPMTRRILLAHGGSITLDSEPGKGTQFSILLPAAPPDQPDRPDRPDRPLAGGDG
ncbi:two-component system sensor histidine kinase NtrB [Tautonia sociabilis]|uniref:histidine kinase n=1 Tax=Tautonia sociabilis TaxID=2080755 RepID=A0A432MHX9_9BACT|nr:ATP-binding protein [Tautonia sociabilis]RUL86963.1 two-component sensor histidine kinase [Tautonia sociabilis]